MRIDLDQYFTVRQVADKLGVSTATVHDYITSRASVSLESVLIGKMRFVPKSALKTFKRPKIGKPAKK